MTTLKNKKLLVLGGTLSTVGVVNEAHEMGVYVIVADEADDGEAKHIADESVKISTTDYDSLLVLIREKKIDGVFCGPSEFNIYNAMNLCEKAGLPFYITRKQWDKCSNKASFKSLCNEYAIPCPKNFKLDGDFLEKDIDNIEYPVIVKPVDGCSSKGITVCRHEHELKAAYDLAMKYSNTGEVIVEKYIVGDYGIVCRYLVCDGEIYLETVNDNFTVDDSDGKIMITAATVFPSKRIDDILKHINPNVEKMIKGLGIKNGTFFMQAKVDANDNNIYFHEMGMRLSGGMMYSLYKKTCGYSDMKMMIRYALGEKMASKDELSLISPTLNGNYVGSLCIPLRPGRIKRIEGYDEVVQDKDVFDAIQYYKEGDQIKEEYMGTLLQHFCRIKVIANSREKYIEKIGELQEKIKVYNDQNEDMIYKYFDINRII